jgi:hypothetical protein
MFSPMEPPTIIPTSTTSSSKRSFLGRHTSSPPPNSLACFLLPNDRFQLFKFFIRCRLEKIVVHFALCRGSLKAERREMERQQVTRGYAIVSDCTLFFVFPSLLFHSPTSLINYIQLCFYYFPVASLFDI